MVEIEKSNMINGERVTRDGKALTRWEQGENTILFNVKSL
jgi:hypothetical protein